MGAANRRWLLVILVAGAALRFYPIWFGLPFPHARPDEEVAVGKALDALAGKRNPDFFHWPSLTFYVFAGTLKVAQDVRAVVADSRQLTLTEQRLVTRGLVAGVGTATILLVYLLARRLGGERVGLMAGTFLAFAILHVRESHFAMTDVPMTFLLWLSLLVLCEAIDGSREQVTLRCAGAGLMAGLAASTKYNAAAAVIGMAAAQAVLFVRTPRAALSWRGWLPSLAYAGAAAGGFLAGTPYALLDYGKFHEDLVFDFTHLSQGHEGVNLGRGWIYHLTRSLPVGVGAPVFAAAALGIVPLVRRGPSSGAILGAFGAAFYLTIGSGYTVFFRYVLPLVPLLCVLAAVGVDAIAGWIASRWRVPHAAVIALLLAATAGPSLVQSTRFDRLLARTDTRVLAAQWLGGRIRAGESLYDAGSKYTRLDLSSVTYDRLDYDPDQNTFSGDPDRLPVWLVLHQSPLRVYTATPAALRGLAQTRYTLAFAVPATRGNAYSAVYDKQDAFFMPVSGFTTVLRPGPSVFIYRRVEVPGP